MAAKASAIQPIRPKVSVMSVPMAQLPRIRTYYNKVGASVTTITFCSFSTKEGCALSFPGQDGAASESAPLLR